MSWHVDGTALASYARGEMDDVAAFSVEAHLPGCPSCRHDLAGMVDRSGLERAWTEVVHEVDRPRAGLGERLLVGLGVPEHAARLLAGTSSARRAWFLAVVASLGFALLATRIAGDGALLFLVIAPLVPLSGVAVAYGPGTDPAHELALASPVGGFRLMLLRTAAVLAAGLGVTAVAALALPEPGWGAFAWLLPCLAMTVLALGLSSWVSPRHAVGALTVAWVLGVGVVERLAEEPFAAFGPAAHVVFAVIAAVSILTVVVRRGAFEVRGRL